MAGATQAFSVLIDDLSPLAGGGRAPFATLTTPGRYRAAGFTTWFGFGPFRIANYTEVLDVDDGVMLPKGGPRPLTSAIATFQRRALHQRRSEHMRRNPNQLSYCSVVRFGTGIDRIVRRPRPRLSRVPRTGAHGDGRRRIVDDDQRPSR